FVWLRGTIHVPCSTEILRRRIAHSGQFWSCSEFRLVWSSAFRLLFSGSRFGGSGLLGQAKACTPSGAAWSSVVRLLSSEETLLGQAKACTPNLNSEPSQPSRAGGPGRGGRRKQRARSG